MTAEFVYIACTKRAKQTHNALAGKQMDGQKASRQTEKKNIRNVFSAGITG